VRIATAIVLAIAALLASLPARTATRQGAIHTVRVSDGDELARLLAAPLANTRIELTRDIDLVPAAAIDPTCGNCEDPRTPVPVTVGIAVSGDNVWIAGNGNAIHTNAGYGIYFRDCANCGIEDAVVTGGERDTAQAATDAAIVVRNSTVTIRNCEIAGNIGDPTTVRKTVVGIMGVCGREGADITVENCEIVRNSWDGIALYRDARAVVRNNYIDGVDRARGDEIGGGRGVAVGVTWNGTALVERNWIRRYWKGIGIFLDADVVARGNIVEEMLTWGIAIWDADRGRPRAVVERNAVYDCGACGISVTRRAPYADGEETGRLTGNIVVHTGQNPRYDDPEDYCFQCALALHAVPEGFSIRGNTYYDNRTAADSLFHQDAPREMFWRGRRGWVRTFRNNEAGIDGRRRFHESAFLTEYPRWWD
jgi:parallel beta-helix repeat protein